MCIFACVHTQRRLAVERRNPNPAVAEAARKLVRARENERRVQLGDCDWAQWLAAGHRAEAARRALAEAVALAKSESD